MYAFDGKQKCFEKIVFSKSNYRPVAYYCSECGNNSTQEAARSKRAAQVKVF